MIAAMHSGAGKTVMSCAILAALKQRGLSLCAFKCGPDYIDPMFHSRVLGVPCRNLDLFLQGEEGVRRTLGRGEGEFAVLEGAMGYYDGVAGTEQASAYEVARLTGCPVLLTLRPKGSALSLAAQVRGMQSFRPESNLAGLMLADCATAMADSLQPILERETGLPVLGSLPPMPEASFDSRHLGLLTAGEITDFQTRMCRLGRQAEQTIDLDRLLETCKKVYITKILNEKPAPACRIAVARDEAFCFLYQDNLDALREAGAELCFFSPLHDAGLPADIAGLYLPGGYPELYAGTLSENLALRESIAAAVDGGMPTVAECGGFLYLQRELEDREGQSCSMCGVLPGRGFAAGRLQRFGYQTLTAERDSLLFHAGEEVPAHEFHHWDSTENGDAFLARKTDGRSWRCGFTSDSLYAAFPHLHFGGGTPLAGRFVKACEKYGKHL